jgi:hypothetical protein
MAISFRRTPDVKLTNYNVSERGLVYPGLIINVRSEDGLVLGSDSKLTRYEDGQYAPFLQKVTVSVDGELGLLLRAEFTFTVEKDSDFTKYNKAFLASGKLVTIEYGWARPHPGYSTNKRGLWKNLTVYDYSWEYDSSAQRYVCTAKAMGQAGTIEDCEFAVGLPNAQNLKIVKETYSAENNRRPVEYPVNSVTDLIIYDAQADKILYDGKTSVDVDVKAVGGGHVVIINMLDSNWFSRLLAKILPAGFIKPSKTPKIYVSLNYLINRVLNEQVIDYHFKAAAYNGTFRPTYKVSDETSVEGLDLLFSPDPGSIAFPGGVGGTYLTDDGLYGVDFNKAIGVNGYDGCIQGNKLKLGNILISLDALRTIDRELEKGRDEKKKADKTDDSNKPEIVMPIKDFIAKISALISNNSGGLIDLTTYQDEDDNKAGRPVINVTDRNYKGSVQSPTPLEFNNRFPGDGVTLSATITSEIPKDAVALNMYATNIKGTTARKVSERDIKKEVERKVYYDNAITYLTEIRTSELPGSEFDEDAVQSATRMIRKYVQNRPLSIVERTNNAPFNLKLKIQIAGVEGFKFGDLITLKGLPPQYKNGVCFRIMRYKHIFESNKWITELETVCDLI